MLMHAEDRGLLYAEACFETFRVIDGSIFDWLQHAVRLRAGLSLFGLDLPDKLEQRCLAEAAKTGDDVLLRVTVTGGKAMRGLMPEGERETDVYIQACSYVQGTAAIHLRTVTWPQPFVPRPAKFTADYAQTIRGLLDLRSNGLLGQDEEALICDADTLYSAATSNVLLFVDGAWATPDADAAMPGVVRSALIKGGAVRPLQCPRAVADVCEAIALTNSGWFVRPVASINGRKLSTDGASFDLLYSVLAGRAGVPSNLTCV